ncbi:helix-turn-helix transcriptional regulator [Limibacter armeniacum]|uniref:helix-turn-helix domain-containing protein n=1 Tax=Limibacter armeniacum TaxID=466084 RepID=UPI002FE5663C
MAEDIIRIKSISELHQVLDHDKPKHPLISVINASEISLKKEMEGKKASADLYYVGLKSSECGMMYGRHHYDFEEGILVFTAPNQVVAATSEMDINTSEGWMLFFHPDLIRPFPLGENIEHFTFFSYDTHEALHLSDDEKHTLNDCVSRIKKEYEERIDNHSQKVIVSSLELLLHYCSRFYERQFNTRMAQNKDIVAKMEQVLKDYFSTGQLTEYGPPSIQYCAEKIHLSANYLSDLLKKETGRSAKDHINDFLIEKAKNKLLSTQDSIGEIAYMLGFNYPHYFSRLFKAKTGLTPQQYREIN